MSWEEENGVRILWKYKHKYEPVIYYSWVRWSKERRQDFYERRFPPPEDD